MVVGGGYPTVTILKEHDVLCLVFCAEKAAVCEMGLTSRIASCQPLTLTKQKLPPAFGNLRSSEYAVDAPFAT